LFRLTATNTIDLALFKADLADAGAFFDAGTKGVFCRPVGIRILHFGRSEFSTILTISNSHSIAWYACYPLGTFNQRFGQQ
jgi:hypothetical protein